MNSGRYAASLALGTLALASGAALSGTAAWLITRASQHPAVLAVTVAVVGVRLFGIARPVLRYAERLTAHRAAFDVLAGVRASVYDALVPLTPARLGSRRRGDALAAVVDDVDAELDRLLRVIAPAVVALLVGAGTIGFEFAVLPAAGAVLAGGLFTSALLGPALSRRHAHEAERRFAAERARLSTEVLDVLGAADELIAAGAVPRVLTALQERAGRVTAAKARAAWANGLGAGVSGAAVVLTAAATALVCVPALSASRISAPTAAALILLPLALAEVLAPLPEAATVSVRVVAARRRLRHLLSAEPAVAPCDGARPLPTGPVHLRLEGVSARWSPHGPVALQPIDLDLPPRRKVAVVGRSGCGKSTLAAVLLRFLDPAGGRYTVTGQDVRTLDPDDVRTVVGLVDDAPYLFATTLAENVRLARPDADDAAVEAALRRARLGDWLDALPQGLATRLGDGAAAVSGGERARIALARAFLADQPVLVLDEPTAALDTAAAQALLEDVLAAAADRTVVLITHRLEGLDQVDQIIDLGHDSVTYRGATLPPTRGPGSGHLLAALRREGHS